MMETLTLRCVAAGVALGVVLMSAAPARAQLVIEPSSVSVDVARYETITRTVALTNAGSEALTFCVSFDRPLQRTEGEARLAGGAAGGGAPCGAYGEVLYRFDEDDLGGGWGPAAIAMTPEGRLFSAEVSGLHRTFEFTPNLALLRSFEHPTVPELDPFPGTWGVGYDTESGTLWWMNGENRSINGQRVTFRVLLLEGDLDGVATGRRIELAPPEGPVDDFVAGGPSYDAATDLFYFVGVNGETRAIWAVDRTGTLAEGYPLRPEPYPPPALIGTPDAHGGTEGGAEGVRIEYAAFPQGAPGFNRIAVVDRWGTSEGEELETPVPAVLFENAGFGPRANPLRSRIDPNGVMYMTFTNFEHTGIVGVRPHPLPPSWLVVGSDAGPEGAWDGTLAPGDSMEVVLTFRAGARAVGMYTSALQAFDAGTGAAVEVPLTLTVTQGTSAEEQATEPEAVSLSAYPNPSAGAATVVLTLDAASDVGVAVYDVLGREVGVLHEGWLAPGKHEFALDGAGLPSGLYLVRAEVGERHLTERVTMVR